MRGREKGVLVKGIRLLGLGALAGLILLVAVQPAVAKKKRKPNPAITATSAVPLASGGAASAIAGCSGKTHVAGGGFAVSPSFTPIPSSFTGGGVRSVPTSTHPDAPKSWAAAAEAFTNPPGSGSFTTFARCERNALGKLIAQASSSATLVPSEARTLIFDCPPGSHVVSGGYAVDPPYTLGSLFGWRVDVIESRRTAPGEWTVRAFNRGTPATPPPTTSTVTGYALCERNAKGQAVGEATASAPISDNARVAADASCPSKQHVISGGFEITPVAGVGSEVPIVFVDEDQPVGKTTWHIGGHEWSNANLPSGKSLQAHAYCKRDAPPKKKKK